MRTSVAAMPLLVVFGAVAGISISHAPADAAAQAARVGDPTTAGVATPPIIAVPGSILPPGAPTVLICGQPAARLGDLVLAQPPARIIVGAVTVIIAGQPAARVGDTISNNAQIVSGCPTVFIGS
jgi:uncharacterized Zn-binding protein involved in type VI secretion